MLSSDSDNNPIIRTKAGEQPCLEDNAMDRSDRSEGDRRVSVTAALAGGPTASRRRTLILLAAAGVAAGLSASGAGGDATAKAGSYGGELGGRHGRNRRGSKPHGDRDKNDSDKDQRGKKGKNKRRGGGSDGGSDEPRAAFQITFANVRNRPVAIEVWESQSAGRRWANHLGIRRLAPAEELTIHAETSQLAARISRDRVVVVSVEAVTAQDVAATAFIATGRWGASGWDPVGVVLAEDDDLGREEGIAAGGVRLARNPFVSERLKLRIELE
jgi:hypothetical protein